LPVPAVVPTYERIGQLQNALADLPQTPLEPEHLFADGMVVRTLIIPAGQVVVGAMHRHEHPVFLLRGEATINTDKGMERIRGPRKWVSPAGAKRALVTHTECEFVTIHLNPTNTQDLVAIEDEIMVPEPHLKHGLALGSERLKLPAPQEAVGPFKEELQGMYA